MKIAASVALALSAVLALSACGGGDEAAAGGDDGGGTGDNAAPQGVYIEKDDVDDGAAEESTFDEVLTFHDGTVFLVEYRGASSGELTTTAACTAFDDFLSLAESGDWDPGGVENEYHVIKHGSINDAGDTVVWETGDNPEPLAVNVPDTGLLTLDSDERDGGDAVIYAPADTKDGQAAVEYTKSEICAGD
ncbi:hypothetical protein [Gordonia sihwensis]|uniref:hypothetical protein n=1 Tax=Gordonia sihwensis TaxID=173559 RepID=UPI003D95BBA7